MRPIPTRTTRIATDPFDVPDRPPGRFDPAIMSRTLVSVSVAVAWVALLVVLARNASLVRSSDAAMRLAKTLFSILAAVFLCLAVAVAWSQRSILLARPCAGIVVAVESSATSAAPVPVIAVDDGGARTTFKDLAFDDALYPGFRSGRPPAVGDAVVVARRNGVWKVVADRQGALVVLAILLAFASLGATLALMARKAIAP